MLGSAFKRRSLADDNNKTLRDTQAMDAGVSDHVWSLTEIAQLADKSN